MNSNDLQKEFWDEIYVEALKQFAQSLAPNYATARLWIEQIDQAKHEAKFLCKIVECIQQQQKQNQISFYDYLNKMNY